MTRKLLSLFKQNASFSFLFLAQGYNSEHCAFYLPYCVRKRHLVLPECANCLPGIVLKRLAALLKKIKIPPVKDH